MALHQPASEDTLDQLDPTTLAISLIPLLPQTNNTNQLVTLPLLAASLSTLPLGVVNAIHFLAQELKLLKEQSVTRSHFSSHPTNPDNENDERDRENREKWLENQKVNHLKKSISSLTQLQTSLQTRLLTKVDALSDLQQTHKRDTQQLADERDGVRAVNQVLKRKIATLEKQLQDSKEIMESVLERVQLVGHGDWSIVEHGVIHLLSPLPQIPTNFSDQVHAQDNSFSSEQLCTFHQQCQGDSSPLPKPTESTTHLPHFLSSATTTTLRNEGHILNRSTTSESNQRTNQRSLALVADLTEELENLRQEVKVELKSKHDEIFRLNNLIQFRDNELKLLMNRLQHFMGLDGFYVRDSPGDQPIKPEYPEEFINHSTVDLESTPRQNQDQRRKNSGLNGSTRRREGSPDSSSSEQHKLEEEIKQLENQLKQVTQSQQFPASPFAFIDRHPSSSTTTTTKSGGLENDRSSLVSVNASDDHAISRVMADLSNQVVELKHKLKEVTRERDALKRLRSRNKKGVSCGSMQVSDAEEADEEGEGESREETRRGLKEALERSRLECVKLNRLLGQSEARILELEGQLTNQELEFERVAERVQVKLKDQRSKMIQAQTEFDDLHIQLNQTRTELAAEKNQVQSLLNLLDRSKKKKNKVSDHHHLSNNNNDSKDSGKSNSNPKVNRDLLVASSSSASSNSSSKPFSHSSKDPFN